MSQFKPMLLEDIQSEAGGYKCQVIVAADNELQFDLDTPEAKFKFTQFWSGVLKERFGYFLPREMWRSKGGHWHAMLTLPEGQSVPERIALQLAGGSDPAREFASLCCHWDGSLHPILLFKPLPVSTGIDHPLEF